MEAKMAFTLDDVPQQVVGHFQCDGSWIAVHEGGLWNFSP
jgi:hypothetical protein